MTDICHSASLKNPRSALITPQETTQPCLNVIKKPKCERAPLGTCTKESVNSETKRISNSLASSDLSNVRVICINVCGLTSKQATPEFIEILNNYDIVCLTEIKTDKADIIDMSSLKDSADCDENFEQTYNI